MIRGPLGIGKSTVSERLAKEIGAEHIRIDRILDEQGLWEEGHVSEFLKANEFAVERARGFLDKGTPVVFDGNFYWKSVIGDLIGRLDGGHYVFTLKAPLNVCIERDSRRVSPHGSQAAREVYAKSTKFDYGIGMDAVQPIERVVGKIVSHISRNRLGGQR